MQPIQISRKKEKNFMENFSLNIFHKEEDNIFTEAVFANGYEKIKPIEEQFQVLKNELQALLYNHSKHKSTHFDAFKFVKSLAWKELENRIQKVFGFRAVNIMSTDEKYNKKKDIFDSMEFNCYTYCTWRYPIDGLVTDNGFFDSTKSITLDIFYTLGTIKELSAEQLTAIFLHELGHNLDPALVTINYTENNVLSKYLTDREGDINKKEKELISDGGERKNSLSDAIASLIIRLILLFLPQILDAIEWLFRFIGGMFFNKEKALKRLSTIIQKEKNNFNRQKNEEAFADNFARMYGYSTQLMSGLRIIGKLNINHLGGMSRIKKEKEKAFILYIMISNSLQDIHKTDMHRAVSLLKEFKKDLSDPNIPKKVKKAIEQDMKELEKIIDVFLNKNEDFENRLNKVIYEGLKAKDSELFNDKNKEISKENK